MFRHQQQRRSTGPIDGDEGRGIPLGGHDERPPTGYRSDDDDISLDWEEDDDLDRRRDPLRKP